jgi:hypothetical protein
MTQKGKPSDEKKDGGTSIPNIILIIIIIYRLD